MAKRTLEHRFWSKVDKRGPDECWLWMGARNPQGPGYFEGHEYGTAAHRVAYQLVKGPIPQGMVVRHKCDMPPCVNPAHLEIGTRADNVQDRVSRGRKWMRNQYWQPAKRDEATRFWRNVAKAGENECWEWQGGLSLGYGTMSFRGSPERTHRVSYIIHHGSIPEGAYILHSCDNKRCVNPAHLSAGTQLQNEWDITLRQGRWNQKLQPGQVVEIKRLLAARKVGDGFNAIAKAFGVTEGCVSAIHYGYSWRHVQ